MSVSRVILRDEKINIIAPDRTLFFLVQNVLIAFLFFSQNIYCEYLLKRLNEVLLMSTTTYVFV